MSPEDVNFPPYQGHCVKVSAINGCRMRMLSRLILEPAPEDKRRRYNEMSMYSFLIESQHRDRRVLFDLAFMKDVDARMPPALKKLFAASAGAAAQKEEPMIVDKLDNVPEAIEAGGIRLSDIDAVIWSHAHLDHTGDPSVFPPSTELVGGPGLKACMPGYPANPDAIVLDSAFHGRNVREINFATSTASTATIGGFPAVDFFQDGSFWLLEAPGHTREHMCALCRTTEDSWVLLTGDAFHHVGQLRPSAFRPLPASVPASVLCRKPAPGQCSCAHLSAQLRPGPPAPLTGTHDGNAHRKDEKGSGSESGDKAAVGGAGAFFNLAPGMLQDAKEAEATLAKLKAFDGRDDVMIVATHDASLLDVLEFFPGNINNWRAKDWAAKGRWLFLREFEDEC